MTGSLQPADAPARVALITGITGQDGYYLTQSLLADGYAVHGTTRDRGGAAASAFRAAFPDGAVTLHQTTLGEQPEVEALIDRVGPQEIYHLAGQSHVGWSFDHPVETLDANARTTIILLEAVRRRHGAGHEIRLLNTASSELFGGAQTWPQTEQTPLSPRSPYACSKAYAYLQTGVSRRNFGLFASNAILYNHESPRRPTRYVTRKITRTAALISAGLEDSLTLGRLDTGRDWGDARDTVRAMRLILAADSPDDFVVATNRWRTLEELLTVAFETVGLDWRRYVRQDPNLIRPAEVSRLQGDYAKANRLLGWEPQIAFGDLIGEMVATDLALIADDAAGCCFPAGG